MKLKKQFALTLSLAAVMGLTAAAARAGTIAKGTFTLPMQTYWNDALLPAGQYSLSLDRNPSGVELVTIRGDGVSAVMLANVKSKGTSSNCLKADEINGTLVVRELDAGSSGSYQFELSKTVRRMMARGDVKRPVAVPVSDSGM